MRSACVIVLIVAFLSGCTSSSELNGRDALSSSEFSYIFVGTPYHGLFRSSDRGVTWQETAGFPKVYPDAMISQGNKLFAIGAMRVYVSIDSGYSWSLVNTSQKEFTSVAVFDSLLIAASEMGNLASSNGGLTWSAPDTNLYAALFPRGFAQFADALYAAGSRGMAFTRDGHVWREVEGLSDCFAISSNPSGVFVATYSAGIYRSADGIRWSANRLSQTDENITALSSSNSSTFIGTDKGLFRSNDFGETWNQVDLGLANNDVRISGLVAKGESVLTATSNGSVLISNDAGTTWSMTKGLLTDTSIVYLGVQ
jgi:photosystem II stability/assembly factor-like uncharacterized protein